jgi:hypothetical protein
MTLTLHEHPFAALQPQLFCEEMRASFKTLR